MNVPIPVTGCLGFPTVTVKSSPSSTKVLSVVTSSNKFTSVTCNVANIIAGSLLLWYLSRSIILKVSFSSSRKSLAAPILNVVADPTMVITWELLVKSLSSCSL